MKPNRPKPWKPDPSAKPIDLDDLVRRVEAIEAQLARLGPRRLVRVECTDCGRTKFIYDERGPIPLMGLCANCGRMNGFKEIP